MKIQREGECVTCATNLVAGTPAYWNKERRSLTCVTCFGLDEAATKAAPPDLLQQALESEAFETVPDTVPAAWSEVKPDVAGKSAQKEFDRRAAKEVAKKEKLIEKDAVWRSEIREKRPVVGRLVTALTPRPQLGPLSQSTTAWDKGAVGERRVAEVLEAVAGIEVLHDRLVPGKGAANIDHIVVCAAGVFVIDAKKYDGTLEVRDQGTMFRTDDRLYVAGRDRTKLTEGVLGQVEAVQKVLADVWPDVPVKGMLCFIGCHWTKLKPKFVKGVTVVWPEALPEHVSKAGAHQPQMDAIASHLRRALKQTK
jgi:Nuclease-related domain